MKKTMRIILILCLFLVALIYANRDLMHFEYSFLGKRNFDPELDAKPAKVFSSACCNAPPPPMSSMSMKTPQKIPNAVRNVRVLFRERESMISPH